MWQGHHSGKVMQTQCVSASKQLLQWTPRLAQTGCSAKGKQPTSIIQQSSGLFPSPLLAHSTPCEALKPHRVITAILQGLHIFPGEQRPISTLGIAVLWLVCSQRPQDKMQSTYTGFGQGPCSQFPSGQTRTADRGAEKAHC